MSSALVTPIAAGTEYRIAPVLLRLFAVRRRWDYAVLAILGVMPLLYGRWIGNVADMTAPAVGCASPAVVTYRGIGSTPNWWFFGIILPAALYLVRETAERLFCLSSGKVCAIASDIGTRIDPREKVQAPLPGDAAMTQQAVSDGIRMAVFRPRTLLWLLLVVVVIHIIDMRDTMRAYVAPPNAPACVAEHDWTVMFQATNTISRAQNLGHVLVAYACQFIAVYLGLLIFVLGFLHNAAYLKLVYQRYRSDTRSARESIVLWFADPARCFGQQRLHELFDIQISALLIAGLVIIISRYRNVSTETLGESWHVLGHHDEWGVDKIFGNFGQFIEHVNVAALFPDLGQVMLALGFLACLLIVALPSALKFLPFRSEQYRHTAAPAYLAQFIPSGADPDPLNMDDEAVTKLAGMFARNSFWPAGDKKAELLFIFSFLVLIGVLIPPPLQDTRIVIIYLIVLIALAFGCAKAAFALYRRALAYIDPRLVTPAKDDDE